jgi:beta-phosphoglucomutase-like phosphatase (HAD superfamily)
MESGATVVSRQRYDAVVFDMDGVVTDTARTHFTAWKRMFDEHLAQQAESGDRTRQPFDR